MNVVSYSRLGEAMWYLPVDISLNESDDPPIVAVGEPESRGVALGCW
jgi:hypothetical protein